MTESFDAFHRVALQSPALRTGRVKTPIRENMLPPPSVTFPSASGRACKKNRAASTWFLRPTYDDDDISLDYDGTVKAGTLPALVERLTLDYLSTFAHRYLLPKSNFLYHRIFPRDQVPARLPHHFQVVHDGGYGFRSTGGTVQVGTASTFVRRRVRGVEGEEAKVHPATRADPLHHVA